MLGQPKKAATLALIFAALAFGACGDDEGSGNGSGSGSASASGAHEHEEPTLSTFPVAEAETTVNVEMKDFGFAMPESVKAGKVLFKVKNAGSQEHEFVIVQGSKELIELEAIGAGKSGELAVVLPAGRYTAKCLVGSGAARHDNLGMVLNFTVA
ncbi:MAG TPA: cupredoxin domain-containing protein [Acidimicrobiales bacterium]